MPSQIQNPISILIVDDHPVVCSGLTSMLSAQPEFQVIGAAASAEEALTSIQRSRPHVVLLDLRMPGMGGIGLLQELGKVGDAPRVIILTSFENDEDIYRAIREGAQGYLLKDTTEAEMISAIHAVHRGERFLPRHIAARLVDRMMRSDLTPRELQILKSLSRSSTNKEIAKSLSISENTVKHHVTSIMEKLQVSDRTGAVATAIRRGLIS